MSGEKEIHFFFNCVGWRSANKKRNNLRISKHNSSFLWLSPPQPRNEELFCLLLWLAAGRWAPWGGVLRFRKREVAAELHFINSFHSLISFHSCLLSSFSSITHKSIHTLPLACSSSLLACCRPAAITQQTIQSNQAKLRQPSLINSSTHQLSAHSSTPN